MSGRIGAAANYHTVVPHSKELGRIVTLSKEARRRLRWMDHYHVHGNARLTCRYYDISPTTFYKWLGRYKKKGPKGLEERSRRPKHVRASQIPKGTVVLIIALRKKYPAWSKYKLSVLLARDHGVAVSASTIGRILKKKGLNERARTIKRLRAIRRRLGRKKADRSLKELSAGSLVFIDTK